MVALKIRDDMTTNELRRGKVDLFGGTLSCVVELKVAGIAAEAAEQHGRLAGRLSWSPSPRTTGPGTSPTGGPEGGSPGSGAWPRAYPWRCT